MGKLMRRIVTGVLVYATVRFIIGLSTGNFNWNYLAIMSVSGLVVFATWAIKDMVVRNRKDVQRRTNKQYKKYQYRR